MPLEANQSYLAHPQALVNTKLRRLFDAGTHRQGLYERRPAGQLIGMKPVLHSCSRNLADEWQQLTIPVLIMYT